MKRIFNLSITLVLMLSSSFLFAGTGRFFTVTPEGAGVDIILCLNGKGPLTCQKYTVPAQTLSIGTTVLNHLYPAAGIKVLTPGYTATGCTPYSNGYCLFSVSNQAPATITINTSLTASVSFLALSVNNPAQVALSGNPRQITITNTGNTTITGLSISYPTWPTGTTVNTSSPSACTEGGSISANGSCTITIVPGATATSGAGGASCSTGIAPIPDVVTVSAYGTQVSTNVVVLNYGCVYQGGFIYSVKDDYPDFPESGSIGGGVVSLVDQIAPLLVTSPGPGLPWDADPACAVSPFVCTTETGAWDLVFGENVPSISGSTNPNNTGTAGPGNTFLISSILNGTTGNSNIPPATYAAGVCISYTGGAYDDWYLPAICVMEFNGAVCPVFKENISNSLSFLVGNPTAPTPSTSCNPPSGTECIAGTYWSSSEFSTNPTHSWEARFSTGGGTLNNTTKGTTLGVRCIRQITPP